MIDEFLVSFLKSNNFINSAATEIAVGQIPVDDQGNLTAETYIWLMQFSEEDSLDLDGESGLTEIDFDCEVCSMNNATAKTLSQQVKNHLQGHSGVFGGNDKLAGFAQGVFVTDKDENYLPRNAFGSDELTIIALNIKIFADDNQG